MLTDAELKRMNSDDRRVYQNASVEEKLALAEGLRGAWAGGTAPKRSSAPSDTSWSEPIDPVDSTTSSDPNFFGPVLIVLGMVVVVWGVFFDASIESGAGGVYGLPDRVVNVGRVAEKIMIFTGGLALTVLGAVVTSTHMILKSVREEG